VKRLILVALALITILASLSVLIHTTGLLTFGDIEAALIAASEINPVLLALVVIVLLGSDLFIAVPTLTVTILSGYFLGPLIGSLSAATGMIMAGLMGYTICWFHGPRLLMKIYKDPEKLQEMREVFAEHGTMVLLICRAVPILPEVCCCLAGANRMAFGKFLTFFSIGTLPYAFIAGYAGSLSSLSDPKPAIYTAIAISFLLWLAWFILLRRNKRDQTMAAP